MKHLTATIIDHIIAFLVRIRPKVYHIDMTGEGEKRWADGTIAYWRNQ